MEDANMKNRGLLITLYQNIAPEMDWGEWGDITSRKNHTQDHLGPPT